MKNDDQKLMGAVVAYAIALIIAAAMLWPTGCGAPRAAAQGATVPAISPTLALARTAVREAGIQAYERDDTAAIHAVVAFRAEHIYRTGYLEALFRATHGAFVRRDAPRAWIVGLDVGGHRPAHWPGSVRWQGVNAGHWRQTLEHSREVLRGAVEHRCTNPATGAPATPHDWGSEHDAVRFRRRNPTAIELDCGQTCALDSSGAPRVTLDGLPRCNHFFSVPRYAARFETL